MDRPRVTRLAPSPTGALHLGNARTFLVNWLLARRQGWRVVLRLEDLDGPRIKRGADLAAVEDLRWLGLDWDEGPVYQSTRTGLYRDAAERLLATAQAYPCVCSRKEVELAASAPHAEDGSAVYPGTCRDRFAGIEPARLESGREPAVRFRVPDSPRDAIEWDDRFRGPQRFGLVAALVGVVDAEDELAAVLAGEQPVEQRRADAADVQVAGRAGGETGANHERLSDESRNSSPRINPRARACAERPVPAARRRTWPSCVVRSAVDDRSARTWPVMRTSWLPSDTVIPASSATSAARDIAR